MYCFGFISLSHSFNSLGYDEETLDNGETRTRLNLHMDVAPVVVAVLPLSKKQPLLDLSRRIHLDLLDREVRVDLDEQGSIGKRYCMCMCVCVEVYTLAQ
jgi:glycyl-tRNA synthetase (class II)